ncbi:YkgJ family cysteine cluster protein [Oleidesulfovibrio alaskensis]
MHHGGTSTRYAVKNMSIKDEEAFDCKMCGHCCLGKGGIVVGPKDLARICAHLGLTPQEFEVAYGERRCGKLMIRTDSDNYCIFFEKDKGCSVHVAKPDICRAWPFFRGNLIDSDSLTMAKDFCPGIRSNVTHAEFAAQGVRYLREQGLLARDRNAEARALIIDDDEAARLAQDCPLSPAGTR